MPNEGGTRGRAHKWRRFVRRMLAFVVVIYVLFMAPLFLIQRRLIYPADRTIERVPSDPPYKYAYEDVMLAVDGYVTNAWFMEVPNARGAVLFSHGNGGNISGWYEVAGMFQQLGLSVLVYDYGGYGRSTGRPSEARIYDDVRAAWKFLTEQKKIPAEKIVLVGRSIGGGPTVQLATEVKPGAVVLESTFLSLQQVAQEHLRFFPVKPLVLDKFANEKKIGQVHVPVMIIHSVDDTLIPIRHARKMFELANEPKTFLEISGDHNEGYLTSSRKYEQGLRDFLGPLLSD